MIINYYNNILIEQTTKGQTPLATKPSSLQQPALVFAYPAYLMVLVGRSCL